MVKILHFSDAHIDIAAHGKRDPQSGLSYRMLDFLTALDTIIDAAINEKVDLVIFSGDAYRDRTPVPTHQREWGKRIVRLSQAGIQTILLTGNHDVSPASGRASALQEFDTLMVPGVHLVTEPQLIPSHKLNHLQVQVIAIPWINKNNAFQSFSKEGGGKRNDDDQIRDSLTAFLQQTCLATDPALPVILTAHATVQGAVYRENTGVGVGQEFIFPINLLKKNDFDYVAMGHIHKAQNLNEDAHPPIVYPGSIEKVDFGEVNEDKYFVLAHVEKGKTSVEWRKLRGRIFLDYTINLEKAFEGQNEAPHPHQIKSYLEENLIDPDEAETAIMRLTLFFPPQWEALIDDSWLRTCYSQAMDFRLIYKKIFSTRLRLQEDQSISSLKPEELLKIYWQSLNYTEEEISPLIMLAKEIIYNEKGNLNGPL
jgi:exonuclease SbcD